MTLIKMCGLRDADSAVNAARVGADFLGFVFVAGARRSLSIKEARDIVSKYRQTVGLYGPKLVGLFANQPINELEDVVQSLGLDMVQLCGEETSEYLKKISVPVIRQIKIRDEMDNREVVTETLIEVENMTRMGHMVSLDRYHPGVKGGTGMSFDWNIAAELASSTKFILSGGLTPENVSHAIEVVHPMGVDVSSGIEVEGIKNSKKIEDFARAVRRAN